MILPLDARHSMLHGPPRKTPLLALVAVGAAAVAAAGILMTRFPPGTAPRQQEAVGAAASTGGAAEACAACGVVDVVRTVRTRAGDAAATAEMQTAFRITVRMEDGSFRTLSQPDRPAVAAGDRVRITRGKVVARP